MEVGLRGTCESRVHHHRDTCRLDRPAGPCQDISPDASTLCKGETSAKDTGCSFMTRMMKSIEETSKQIT